MLQVIRVVTLAAAVITASVAAPGGWAAAGPAVADSSPARPAATPPVAADVGVLVGSERLDRSWESNLQNAGQQLGAAQQRRQAAAQASARARRASPTPPPLPSPSPGESVQQIIQQAFAPFGEAAQHWGLRVAKCESGFDPQALNPDGPYYGLFQFSMSTFLAYSARAGYAYSPADIWQPNPNAEVAAFMYSLGKEGEWGCN